MIICLLILICSKNLKTSSENKISPKLEYLVEIKIKALFNINKTTCALQKR